MGTIDTRLLRAAVEGVEEVLRDMRRAMPPRKKAELVEAAYLLLAEDRQDEVRARTVLRVGRDSWKNQPKVVQVPAR